MPRRRRASMQRVIAPDSRYGDETLARFINALMKQGKKSVAERVVYGALEEVERKGGAPATLKTFHEALENVMPDLEVRSRRVGGATYQVPVDVRPARRRALAIRWLIRAARARAERAMPLRLANELLEASAGRGAAVRRREETHRMAEANRAFSHYRW